MFRRPTSKAPDRGGLVSLGGADRFRLRLRDAPAHPVDRFVHALMLSEAMRHDFDFDLDIFKTCMRFVKIGVVLHVGIDGFRARFDIARRAFKSVIEAEAGERLLHTDCLASHVPNAKDFRAVGEKIAVLGLGQPPLRRVEGGGIKPRIVRAHRFDVVPPDCVTDAGAGFIERADAERGAVDAFEVLRDLRGVVR